jgi:hypothetical protein
MKKIDGLQTIYWGLNLFYGHITPVVSNHQDTTIKSGLNDPDREGYVFADRENYAQK